MAIDTKTIEIHLFKLERVDSPGPDETASMIVAAADEKQARQIANGESGAEGYIWTDGHIATARDIGIANDGVEGVLLSSRLQ